MQPCANRLIVLWQQVRLRSRTTNGMFHSPAITHVLKKKNWRNVLFAETVVSRGNGFPRFTPTVLPAQPGLCLANLGKRILDLQLQFLRFASNDTAAAKLPSLPHEKK